MVGVLISIWSVVGGSWSVVCGLWSVVCGLWSVVCGRAGRWAVVLYYAVLGHPFNKKVVF